jgi:hypothetical protein
MPVIPLSTSRPLFSMAAVLCGRISITGTSQLSDNRNQPDDSSDHVSGLCDRRIQSVAG